MQKFTFNSDGKKQTVFADKMRIEFMSYGCRMYNFYRNRLEFNSRDKEQLVASLQEVKDLTEEHDYPYEETPLDLRDEIDNLHRMILTLKDELYHLEKKTEKKTGWLRRIF